MMTGNEMDVIWRRHMEAVRCVGDAGLPVDLGAVGLALRLAVDEAFVAGGALANDLVAVVGEMSGVQGQLAAMDADNAALAARLRLLAGVQEEAARLRQEVADLREQVIPDYQGQVLTQAAEIGELGRRLREAQQEIDRLTRENGIVVDVFNSRAADNGVDPTPAALPTATVPGWSRSHPAWSALPAADLDVIEQLNAGTTTSRRLSGSLRRDLVLAVIRWLAQEGGATPTMFQFDSSKPGWMGMASGVVALVEDRSWASLVALALAPPKK